MNKLLTTFAFIMLSIGILSAQKAWTLEECINHAIENNIQVKQRTLTLEESELTLKASKLNTLPSLNLFASHGYNWGKSVDRYTNLFADNRVQSNNFYASTSLDLFNGFQKLNTIWQNKLDLEAAGYDFEKYLDDVSLNIATFYLQTLFYAENLKNAQSQFKVTQEQVDRTQKLVIAGALAEGELLSLEARMATEKLNVIEAENYLTISYLTLSQLLDLPNAKGFSIVSPEINLGITIPELNNAEQVYEYAVQNQPEIKSAEIRVVSAEKGVKIAKGTALPTLTAQFNYGTGYSGANQIEVLDGFETKKFKDQIDDNVNKALNFNLNVPVFNGYQSKAYIARQKIAHENSKLELELVKQNLQKTIETAYTDALASLNKYAAAHKKVYASEKALDYATKKFEVKAITYVEYIESKKEYDNASRELITSKFDYIFKKTVLDFYMGKPLTLN
ncbi:MAG: TolC family protein [Bacteroidales bacterium]|nr:TolC family protein [Bacteroidales bacterium]